MDFTWQDLVDYLLAPSGAIPQESSGIYLLDEEDNCLIEKLWSGSEILEQVFIAEDVRTNTPAVYLLDDDTVSNKRSMVRLRALLTCYNLLLPALQRLVFYVDTQNVLRRSRYDADEEEWQAVELEGGEDVIIPQKSKLSGCFTPGGQTVFFQNQSGQLQGIQIRDSTWELSSPVPAEPLEATRHLVIRSADGNLYLFYIGRDRYIHYLVEGCGTGEWHGIDFALI